MKRFFWKRRCCSFKKFCFLYTKRNVSKELNYQSFEKLEGSELEKLKKEKDKLLAKLKSSFSCIKYHFTTKNCDIQQCFCFGYKPLVDSLQQNRCNFLFLPKYLWRNILKKLDKTDLLKCRLVSTTFKIIIDCCLPIKQKKVFVDLEELEELKKKPEENIKKIKKMENKLDLLRSVEDKLVFNAIYLLTEGHTCLSESINGLKAQLASKSIVRNKQFRGLMALVVLRWNHGLEYAFNLLIERLKIKSSEKIKRLYNQRDTSRAKKRKYKEKNKPEINKRKKIRKQIRKNQEEKHPFTQTFTYKEENYKNFDVEKIQKLKGKTLDEIFKKYNLISYEKVGKQWKKYKVQQLKDILIKILKFGPLRDDTIEQMKVNYPLLFKDNQKSTKNHK